MSRFQQGSLFKLERKSVPDVWVFRWYENTLGKRTYKKQIIGSVTKLRNRRERKRTSIALRSSINAEVGTPKSVCDLAAHYRLHELTRERKAFSTIENHLVPGILGRGLHVFTSPSSTGEINRNDRVCTAQD